MDKLEAESGPERNDNGWDRQDGAHGVGSAVSLTPATAVILIVIADPGHIENICSFDSFIRSFICSPTHLCIFPLIKQTLTDTRPLENKGLKH